MSDIFHDLTNSIRSQGVSGIDISVSRIGENGQTMDVGVAPYGPEDAAPFEMLVGPGGLVLSIGNLLQLEIDPRGPESRNLVLDLFWANATGGSAIYRVGWRRYFVAGDHVRLSSDLQRSSKSQRAQLVAKADGWAVTYENQPSLQFTDEYLIHHV